MHLYTGYKITDKAIGDMTRTQYTAILIITDEISKKKKKAIAVV